MLAEAFASIVFVVSVATTIILIAYAAPLLLELIEMVGNKTSGTEVMIQDVALRGSNSLWDPYGQPASPLASASGATLSLVLKVVSAMVEYAEDIACYLINEEDDSRKASIFASAVQDEWWEV
ncbi:hypothetical protein FCIRC_13270 [Fusarium circinatum]|uniref:Uncharacterized protein n=1 Tax=Fusarium circinatum TaxID=48490 RepID=A0A8H5WCI1_FUSCI|nr:hypothetical protein FCIRC_13270 [Fusarium circinatum]